MRRRLRKKRRLGEFREFGFVVEFDSPEVDIEAPNQLLFDFLDYAIEPHGLCCGGGGGTRQWRFIVSLYKKRGSTTDAHREAVKRWLDGDPRVAYIQFGPPIDLWHCDE